MIRYYSNMDTLKLELDPLLEITMISIVNDLKFLLFSASLNYVMSSDFDGRWFDDFFYLDECESFTYQS